MAAQFKVGSFTGPASSAAVPLTGFGFTPKLFLLFDTQASSWQAFGASMYQILGMSTGSSIGQQRSARMGAEWDGVAFFVEQTRRSTRGGEVVSEIGTAFSFTNVIADVDSFDVDGVTLGFTVFAAVQRKYFYLAIGGADVTAKWGTIAAPTSIGEQTYTDPGFEPDLVLFQAGSIVPGGQTDVSPGGVWSVGWADRGGRMGSSGWHARASANPNEVHKYQRSDKCLFVLNPTTGVVDGEAEFRAYTSLGFKLDWTTAPAATSSITYIAIQGVKAFAGAITQPTAVGIQTIDGLDIQPLALLFQTANVAASTSVSTGVRYAIGLAAADGAFSSWVGDNHGTNFAGRRASKYQASGIAVIKASTTGNGTGTVEAAAGLDTLGDGEFSLYWPTVDGTEPEILYLALAAEDVTPTPVEEDLCGKIEEPVLFASVLPVEGDRLWRAVTALPDDAEYYGGRKRNGLLGLSDVKRSLSGPDLDYQVGTFRLSLADDDYAIRSLLDETAFSRLEVEAFLITPSGRRAGLVAPIVATGRVDSDPEFDSRGVGLSVDLTCRDALGIAMGWTSTGQSKLPRRVLNQTTLPGVITAMVGKGAPIPGGYLGPAVPASGYSHPIPSGIASIGAFQEGAFWTAGYAPWNQTVAPVAGLMLSTSAGGDCPERDFAVQVFPVDASDNVGDPTPFVQGTDTVTVTAPNQTIDVAWLASPQAVKYYVVLFAQWFGWRAQQIIETTLLACSFNHAFDTPDPGTGFSTGAVGVQDGRFYYYSARSRDGASVGQWHEDVDPVGMPEIFAGSFYLPNGKIRPTRIEWVPSGAPQYDVKKRAAGPFTPQIFSMLPSANANGLVHFDDDYDDSDAIVEAPEAARPAGRVLGSYTRDVVLPDGNTWREILIAGIAIHDILGWKYDPGGDVANIETDTEEGGDFLIPFHSGWSAMFGAVNYRDVLGADGVTRRYTPAYARNTRGDLLASGTSIMSFDLEGAETAGDCSGALITDLHDWTVFLLNNFILASGEGYTSGLYGDAPTQGWNGYPVVDADSFDAVKAMRALEIPGGIIVAGVLGSRGELVDVATELQRLQESGDFRLGPNRRWQIKAAAIDQNLSPLFITSSLSAEFDVHVRTFAPRPRAAELENVFGYVSKRDHVLGGWINENVTRRNQASIAKWRREKQGGGLEFHYIENDAVVGHILSRHVARRGDAPVYVELEGDLCLMGEAYDVGEYFLLTHWRGIAVDGWTDRVMWILGNTFLPDKMRVRLECLDVTPLLGTSRTYALLEGLMDIDLGGSRQQVLDIVVSPQTVEAWEYRDRRFPWEVFPDGTTLTARIEAAVPSGVSLVAHLYDVDAAAIVATDPTPFTSSTFSLHTFQITPVDVNTIYRLRAVVTGGSGQSVAFFGALRPDLP